MSLNNIREKKYKIDSRTGPINSVLQRGVLTNVR